MSPIKIQSTLVITDKMLPRVMLVKSSKVRYMNLYLIDFVFVRIIKDNCGQMSNLTIQNFRRACLQTIPIPN